MQSEEKRKGIVFVMQRVRARAARRHKREACLRVREGPVGGDMQHIRWEKSAPMVGGDGG